MPHFRLIAAALALSVAGAAVAQTPPATPTDHAHPTSAATPALDVPDAARAPVEVVEAFSKALAAADFATVERLLDPDVLILESGGAERSRDEYLGHHAKSDAKFLAGARSTPQRRRARIDGDLAWVGSEGELHATSKGKPVALRNTETMVLRRTADGWRIVHVHWSSRPKKD
jgi:ketosteroid isomerase-like protein